MVFLSKSLAFASFVSGTSTRSAMERFSAYSPLPLSLETMMQFGTKDASEKKSFLFLRQELPTRLANIMKELKLMPQVFTQTSSVKIVDEWYQQSFGEIVSFEFRDPEDPQVVVDFTEILGVIQERHSKVVPTMAQGVIELKEWGSYSGTSGIETMMEHQLQYFLDRFYISRIAIRMLINQHTILFGKERPDGHDRHIGAIDPKCDIDILVKDAYENAKFLCEHYYAVAPEINISTHNATCPNTPIQLPYVPKHLYHMLFELFKNSMRAVVEHVDSDGSDIYPPIDCLMVKGSEDVTIRISDQGGGIPRSMVESLFTYTYSTAPQPPRAGSTHAPLAGYGFGLPLSRVYARYFQGDLVLNSVEGHGIDAVIFLKTLSTEANELLPIYNKTSSKHYHMAIPTPDWSAKMPGTSGNHSNAPTHSLKHSGIKHLDN